MRNLVFAICILALADASWAQLCQSGITKACSIQGKPGTQTCSGGAGGWGPCVLSPTGDGGGLPIKLAVTTYHYNNLRTGWNSQETVLNPASIVGSRFFRHPNGFQLLSKVALDDRVSAQPLIVPDVTFEVRGAVLGRFDVVYVVTESNTIYAIDANTGRILLHRNLGPNVDPGCGPRAGIESTPVIDPNSRTMYLIAYTSLDRPTYHVHAIDISTLNDKIPPVAVAASNKLSDGSSVAFNAIVQRQRSALLLQNGIVYAGFASFCDGLDNTDPSNQSRGWILGWQAATLQPLQANILANQDATANLHLSSIWMSGYGIAADSNGSLFFATGNSNDSYPSRIDLAESVVKVSGDLNQVQDQFTPFGDGNVCPKDQPICLDMDLGSGGVLLLPDQPGSVPHLAAAAGKDGRMFLINRDHMGGLTQPLDMKPIGGVLGGQSYYPNNIVASGGSTVGVWSVNTMPSPSLTQIHSSPPSFVGVGSQADGGFFTSISSNGRSGGVIWAVTRAALAPDAPVTLAAFQPVPGTFELKLLFQSTAGTWDGLDNSKIVPVVANGHVYVASNKELDIFGFPQPQQNRQ